MITSSDGPNQGQKAQEAGRELPKLVLPANPRRGRFDHLTRGDVLRRLIDLHVSDNCEWRFPRR